ncbi:protein of unknown function [Legionella micdadei]|uniref:Type IV pilus assembly protein PilO n=1 Tax=Legionella micdadei TaxID=451 RepID=A0A098GDC2_LEGMI|nr:type 4a pilus biogenesis protein PilO [Legionella micdadei]KTD28614.1 type IV pilus biogenesis protein PilO [Legionella micdadei]CEG60493.1 protein of unknown function [Legionella micdadei]SCX79956.1 type IV pilus assembly protein PilO [Legionella micdadei]
MPISLSYHSIIAFTIFFTLINYWLIVKADFEQYKILSNQAEKLEIEYKDKQQVMKQNDDEMSAKYLNDNYQKMIKFYFNKEWRNDLLTEVHEICIKSGITLGFFSPQPKITHQFLVEEIIDIVVIGEYHQLAVFISKILQLNHLIGFDAFEVKKFSTSNHQNNFEKLRMEIKTKFYQYKQEVK